MGMIAARGAWRARRRRGLPGVQAARVADHDGRQDGPWDWSRHRAHQLVPRAGRGRQQRPAASVSPRQQLSSVRCSASPIGHVEFTWNVAPPGTQLAGEEDGRHFAALSQQLPVRRTALLKGADTRHVVTETEDFLAMEAPVRGGPQHRRHGSARLQRMNAAG
eukprot:9498957-Pyramimonas_sp.AAC.1